MHTPTNVLLEFVVNAKKGYRQTARGKTWEEKVEAIRKMRIANQLAKEGMHKTMMMRELAKRQ